MDILIKLEQTISAGAEMNEAVQKTQDMLLGLLQVLMVRIGSSIDTETGEKIVKLIIMVFEQQQRVTDQGLIAY